MNKYKRGFTLIELLVVILIIGVLAAVALPQYQKAILKSRYSALMPITKSLAEANEVYYLERGEYSNDPTELNIQGQEEYPDGTSILMYDENGLSYVRATNSNVPNARYLVYQKNSENFPGTTMCEASDDPAKALCVALGGEEVPGGNSSGEDGWTAYLLTGGYGSTDSFYTQDGCRTADKPADVTASQSRATGTATCVNGQWKYQWTGGKVYDVKYTKCSSGNAAYACAGSTFSAEQSYCEGWAANGCAGSTFSGKGSYCFGYKADGCTGAIIQAGAYCDAYTANSCDGALYGPDPTGTNQGMGACRDDWGNCPSGVPLRGDWKDGYYDITGWKGNCCNPAYMVSGECPAGIAICS